MEAANNGKIEVVKELLKAGANKKLKNKDGETAYDLASKEEIKALLSASSNKFIAQGIETVEEAIRLDEFASASISL